MELTIGALRKIIKDLPDEVVLASLGIGNDNFIPYDSLKRLLLLKDMESGTEYLTINSMGSHFSQTGKQKRLIYMSKYWDEDTLANP